MSEKLLKEHNEPVKIHESFDFFHVCECKYKDFHLYIRTNNTELIQQFLKAADQMMELLVPDDTEGDCEVHN